MLCSMQKDTWCPRRMCMCNTSDCVTHQVQEMRIRCKQASSAKSLQEYFAAFALTDHATSLIQHLHSLGIWNISPGQRAFLGSAFHVQDVSPSYGIHISTPSLQVTYTAGAKCQNAGGALRFGSNNQIQQSELSDTHKTAPHATWLLDVQQASVYEATQSAQQHA